MKATLLLRSESIYAFALPISTHHLSYISILSCRQWAVGSNGTVDVEYTRGGVPVILVPDSVLQNSGLCGNSDVVVQQLKGQLASSALAGLRAPAPGLAVFVLFVLGLVSSGFAM